jgi:hypothetical protein
LEQVRQKNRIREAGEQPQGEKPHLGIGSRRTEARRLVSRIGQRLTLVHGVSKGTWPRGRSGSSARRLGHGETDQWGQVGWVTGKGGMQVKKFCAAKAKRNL